jgi:hypothetical protein
MRLIRWQQQVGPSEKNPPKMRSKKFVKLTGHIHPGNSLTNFKYESQAMTGNRNGIY